MVREVKVFGNKFELKRKITAFFSTPKIIIEDNVENIGFIKSPIMILYHVNIGYPVLGKTSKLLESKAKVTPRDEEARKGFNKFNEFSDPIKSFNEQKYAKLSFPFDQTILSATFGLVKSKISVYVLVRQI